MLKVKSKTYLNSLLLSKQAFHRIKMNDDDIPPPRFAGHTYSRSRQNRSIDDGSSVPVKAAVSLSKWGQANYVPYREGFESATADAKKPKLETRGEDPFSFDSEDKSKSPVKKQHSAPKTDRPTMLPASRIDTSGKAVVEQANEKGEQPTIRTYSRTPVAKKDIEDQFMEVGKFINKEGNKVFIPQKPKPPLKEETEEDDDIFPAVFKRDPLKTYAGEVVTPIVRPDSPPPKKGRYQKTGGQRGRKPLTVSDPGLIEEYKRNYAAQQKKGKTDTDTGGLNNSMVVSKQELANDDQGTTVVVVCKPKAQIEKGEVSSKYFTRSPRKFTVLDVASDSSQESTENSENGKAGSNATATPTPEGASLRTRNRRLVNASPMSIDSASSNSQTSPICKRLTRGRSSNADWSSQSSGTANDNSSPSEGSGSRVGKRYRIFKSRTQVEESKDTEVKEAHTEGGLSTTDSTPISQQEKRSEDENDSVKVEAAADTEDPTSSKSQDETSEMSQEASSSQEVSEEVPVTKEIDATTARQSLATRLKNLEKENESDSTEQDNASECSETLPSQESPANSQTVEEKEDTVAAPRRFFKSKKSISNSSDLQRKIFGSSPQKSPAKAIYNARSWQNENTGDKEEEAEKRKTRSNSQDDVVLVKDSSKGPRLSREVHWPEKTYDEAYTSLRVNKKHKELYTVVHNVKQTHEVQELGETQDFMDDVDYLLDSLRDTNSTSIRCLSCLKLAGKCIMPAFRMHIRAHGTVGKIFSLLHDACSDPTLALSTSTMMFMLSRDRLNMDLDKESLNLMLKLNEVDVSEKGKAKDATIRELGKTKERVQELLAQLQQETNAREIDLGFVSTGNLAMESLLSLTSRRAGEWFKEELRSVGGLDHIVDSVVSCEQQLTEDMETNIQKALPSLKKLDRCLRVLENISHMNSDNQACLINYKNAALLVSCGRTLRLCQKCMPSFKVLESVEDNKAVKDLPGFTILTCLLAVLRVLLNVTHEHNLGSFSPSDAQTLMAAALHCLISIQWCIPMEQRFDLAVLSLGLLINMMESTGDHHKTFMEMKVEVKHSEKSAAKTVSAVQAVVDTFCQREEAAREMEETNEGNTEAEVSESESPNKSGEWKETDAGIQWITNNLKKAKEEQEKQAAQQSSSEQPDDEGNQSILEDDDETFTKALHKAGKHMENSIVASYAGLLLGSIMIDNKEYTSHIKKIIPNHDFKPMIKILKKFLNFMSLTTAFGSTDVNGITRVIEVLESA